VRSNALAVNRVARKVNFLMKARYGKPQMNLQHVHMAMRPTNLQPVCFDVGQFDYRRTNGTTIIPGTQVFQFNTTTGGIDTPYHFLAGPPLSSNYQGMNPLWQGLCTDLPDSGAYLPTHSTYYFRVAGRNALDNVHVSFTLFREKRQSERSAPAPVLDMPYALQYLDNMAEPVLNQFPTDRYKKYWHRTMFFNSTKTDQYTKGTTANVKHFSFTVKHRGLRTQNKTFPATPDSLPTNPIDPSLDFGPFGIDNTPSGSQLWLLISTTDTDATTNEAVSITCQRKVYWRDSIGARAY